MVVVGCDNDPEPDPTPEPVVFNFYYLSVDLTCPIDSKTVTEVVFHADNLKDYTYVLHTTGSRRIRCASNTFLDADDVLVAEDVNSLTYDTDADNVFDVEDLNGNISRFTPATTGATSMTIHMAGVVLTDDQRTAYVAEATRQVNFMPNQVFEIVQ